MNKRALEEQVLLLCNLASQAKNLADHICRELAPEGDEELYNFITQVQCAELTDESEIKTTLFSICDKIDGIAFDDPGEEVFYPRIKIDDGGWNAEITQKVPGGELAAAVYPGDYGTKQIGLMYNICLDSGITPIDLALAEVKRGEIAEADGKPKDNRDIDLYCYSDPYSEDFTSKNTILYRDIEDAVTEGE